MADSRTMAAAMHLPELVGIELADQVLQRHADVRVLGRRDDAGVFVLGLEEVDLVHRHDTHGGAHAGGNPFDRLRPRSRPSRRERTAGRSAGLAGLQARLKAADGEGEPVALDRFQQIVDRAIVEGLDGEFIVGGDKHHMGVFPGCLRNLEAGRTRHLDIQEGDVGAVAADGFNR